MDVIVDIDGTIADMRHRRHFVELDKNWPAFYEAMVNDLPINPVIEIVQSLYANDDRILICTGRPETYWKETEEWLHKHNVPCTELFMRKIEDYRADYIAKEELLHEMIQDGYRPKLALEDKQECVDMWRRNGIITLQNSMRHMA